MFTEMRRKEKQMTPEAASEVLLKAEFGTLASLGENGYPYAVPLNFAYVDGAIYFHSAKDGHKLMNIEKHAKVSFAAVSYVNLRAEKFDTEYDSVVVFGTAAEVTTADEKRRGLMALIEKYSAAHGETGKAYIERSMGGTAVYKITVEHMTGKIGR